MYLLVKHIHITTAVLSGLGFMLRGIFMWRGSALLQHPVSKIAPHVNDSILLASAVYLAVISQQYPFTDHWLTAKLIALIIYILLGTLALKRAKNLLQQKITFLLAMMTYFFILSAATSRSPLGILEKLNL